MLCAFARHGSRRSSWSGAAADGAYAGQSRGPGIRGGCADEPFDVGVLPRTLGGDEGKVGARRTADLCFLTPPSRTVPATFTAHGSLLVGQTELSLDDSPCDTRPEIIGRVCIRWPFAPSTWSQMVSCCGGRCDPDATVLAGTHSSRSRRRGRTSAMPGRASSPLPEDSTGRCSRLSTLAAADTGVV